MNFNHMQSPYLRALIRKYEFERDEALALLDGYFSQKSTVDVHTIDCMDSLLTQVQNSENNLKVLIAHFTPQQTAAQPPAPEKPAE